MKYTILAAMLLFTCCGLHAQHSLTKLWATDTTLPTPESVLYDAQNKVLYVSLIDGDASTKDGKGGVAKVGLDGKIIDKDWITGLDAPKGIGKYNGMLYVADIADVIVIDISAGKVVKKIPVTGAVFLNDVTVDSKGIVYVSDTRGGKIYRIENGVPAEYVDGIKGANGVLAVGTDLYMLGGGSLFKADAQKNVTSIGSGMESSTDGIEEVKHGEFLISSWNGVIYYFTIGGGTQQILDTRPEKSNTADIGYNAAAKIVYVPTFLKNGVVAYKLK